MTSEELVTRIKQHVGNRASSTISRSWYLDRLQDAYQDLTTFNLPLPNGGMRPLRFNELYDVNETTLSSSMDPNFKAWTSTTWSMIGLYDLDNDRPIDEKPLRHLLRQDPEQTGRVLMWAPYGHDGSEGYLVWPIPSSDLNVREYIYKRAETLTDSSSSTPVIPSDWHAALHVLGGHKAAHLLNIPDLATTLANEFLAIVRSKRLPREESQRSRRSIHVGQRSYAWR